MEINRVYHILLVLVLCFPAISFGDDAEKNTQALTKNINQVLLNLSKATFKPVRKGWQHDYGFQPETGILNTFEYIRSLLSFGDLQNSLSVPVFLSGPHGRNELNLTARNDFGHYNPAFLNALLKSLKVLLADKHFVEKTYSAFEEKGLSSNLQRFYAMRKYIEENPNEFQRFKTQFQDRLKSGKWPEGGYREFVPQNLNQETYWNWSETDYYFWIRRDLDGTMAIWTDIMMELFRAYVFSEDKS